MAGLEPPDRHALLHSQPFTWRPIADPAPAQEGACRSAYALGARGRHKSRLPPEEYGLGALADLLRRVVVALGVERPILMGHSSPPEVRGAAMTGLLDRVSLGWHTVREARIPTLLVLATEPPFGDQNRRAIATFQAGVPHAEVWWVPDAGHDLLADSGPSIAEDIALDRRELQGEAPAPDVCVFAPSGTRSRSSVGGGGACRG